MKTEIFKCDKCNKEHDVIFLPIEWMVVSHPLDGGDKHFCSMACLMNWASWQVTLNNIKSAEQVSPKKQLAQEILNMIDKAYEETDAAGRSTQTFHRLTALIYNIEHICKTILKKGDGDA